MDSIKIDNSSCIFVKISITGLTKTEEIWDGIGLVIDGGEFVLLKVQINKLQFVWNYR